MTRAREDDQPRIGQPFEPGRCLLDGNNTVACAPDEKRRSGDRSQLGRDVGTCHVQATTSEVPRTSPETVVGQAHEKRRPRTEHRPRERPRVRQRGARQADPGGEMRTSRRTSSGRRAATRTETSAPSECPARSTGGPSSSIRPASHVVTSDGFRKRGTSNRTTGPEPSISAAAPVHQRDDPDRPCTHTRGGGSLPSPLRAAAGITSPGVRPADAAHASSDPAVAGLADRVHAEGDQTRGHEAQEPRAVLGLEDFRQGAVQTDRLLASNS